MKIAMRIRRARRHTGMSQTQLSKAIAVQRSAVSNWESANEIYPAMANLIAIARTCEVSLEWLGTGRGAMFLNGVQYAEVPTAHAELVEASDERELLAAFRSLPQRSQSLFLELISTMKTARQRKVRSATARGRLDHGLVDPEADGEHSS